MTKNSFSYFCYKKFLEKGTSQKLNKTQYNQNQLIVTIKVKANVYYTINLETFIFYLYTPVLTFSYIKIKFFKHVYIP